MARNKIVVHFEDNTTYEIDKDCTSCVGTMSITNGRAVVTMRHYVNDGTVQLNTDQDAISAYPSAIVKVELMIAMDDMNYITLYTLLPYADNKLNVHYTIGSSTITSRQTNVSELVYIETIFFDYISAENF